jgi:ribosome biogenesis GTPase / thiamine phosphate phosphatase
MSGTSGIIIEGTGGVWRVRTADGTERDAALAGRLKQEDRGTLKLAVGDHVSMDEEAPGQGWRITAISPRTSVLARREPGRKHGERVLAANVDQVLVVFSVANPEPHIRMIDRFLVVCEANDLHAHLVLNKVDLGTAPGAVEALAAPYERAGYSVHRTSTKRGDGLEEMRAVLRGRITAFTGPSGVGKSSLLNALHPGLALRTQEISASVNKGRHTTVGAKLIPIPGGDGYLVDTPGLREVGMWGLPSESLDQCFPEFRPMLGECRFQDCKHDSEPECAVIAGVRSGALDRGRYDSYLKLLGELTVSERVR